MPIYSATFTFAKREWDDAFHSLDQTIASLAKAIPGYLGEDAHTTFLVQAFNSLRTLVPFNDETQYGLTEKEVPLKG